MFVIVREVLLSVNLQIKNETETLAALWGREKATVSFLAQEWGVPTFNECPAKGRTRKRKQRLKNIHIPHTPPYSHIFPPPHLQVHVSQLVLSDEVIDASHLQPGLWLFLSLAQINRNPQALLGVVQRFTRWSAIQNPEFTMAQQPKMLWERVRGTERQKLTFQCWVRGRSCWGFPETPLPVSCPSALWIPTHSVHSRRYSGHTAACQHTADSAPWPPPSDLWENTANILHVSPIWIHWKTI